MIKKAASLICCGSLSLFLFTYCADGFDGLKVLPEPTEELAEKIWLMFDCDKKRREEVYHTLRDWVYTQPHLPKNIDETKYLVTFVWCKNSLERTKGCIDMYYTLRGALPEIFANRDPASDTMQKTFALSAFLPLPRLTEKLERVCIIRGMLPDLSELVAEDTFKTMFMVNDIRTMYDAVMGDVFIIDLLNITPAILAKYTPTLLKKVAVLAFKAFSAKIKGIHIVNAPPYADVLVNVLRAVIHKEKIRDRILVHSKGLDSLYSFVDKKILPKEYGGDGGDIQALWDDWKETLLVFREWFLEQENVKADESKRPVKPLTSNDLFGFEGSFRQLSMD